MIHKSLWEKYQDYITQNSNIEYSVSFQTLPGISATHKWVGAQSTADHIYGIPSDMDAVLKYNNAGVSYLGEVGQEFFKWTGGCIWEGFLYGFSRSSNTLLKMSLETEQIQYIWANERYSREHHYGGICTKNGMIYQPPRDSNHLLVWDLSKEKTEKIYLTSQSEDKQLRYCGSILHPNGFAYFLPEYGERVIKFNIRTREWTFIGEQMDAMVFDAKVGSDHCIYGYSAYCPGILKIDTENDSVEMIHQEINPGAFGTKLGVNGHLYSIPGNGSAVWDYDPRTDSLKSIYRFTKTLQAKYAGGTSMRDGSILAVPAEEEKIFQLIASVTDLNIPEDIYQEYFLDCY